MTTPSHPWRNIAGAAALLLVSGALSAAPLGLPPVPVPANNPQTPAKIALGDKLFHDERFSTTGKVSCATCHDKTKAFTDGLRVSEGIETLTGTRNAPTVVNAAYMQTQFWDGREPDLEGQSKQPFLNPVEMGLANHDPILKVVSADADYQKQFKAVFGKQGAEITIDEVAMAIAAFEREQVAGDSPFDRYLFGNDPQAMTEAQIRGFNLFRGKARCVSCHTIEQDHALFTDNRFHNIGVGFKRIRGKVNATAAELAKQKHGGTDVDVAVLTNENLSELGRFAVTGNLTQVGAFKTATVRNIAATAPYMHDGSLETLEDVVDFYVNGGREKDTDPVDDFLSGGIRSLDLSKEEKKDLVEFLKALTSPQYASAATR